MSRISALERAGRLDVEIPGGAEVRPPPDLHAHIVLGRPVRPADERDVAGLHYRLMRGSCLVFPLPCGPRLVELKTNDAARSDIKRLVDVLGDAVHVHADERGPCGVSTVVADPKQSVGVPSSGPLHDVILERSRVRGLNLRE